MPHRGRYPVQQATKTHDRLLRAAEAAAVRSRDQGLFELQDGKVIGPAAEEGEGQEGKECEGGGGVGGGGCVRWCSWVESAVGGDGGRDRWREAEKRDYGGDESYEEEGDGVAR